MVDGLQSDSLANAQAHGSLTGAFAIRMAVARNAKRRRIAVPALPRIAHQHVEVRVQSACGLCDGISSYKTVQYRLAKRISVPTLIARQAVLPPRRTATGDRRVGR